MEHRQQYGSSHGDPWYDGGPYAAGPPGDPWDEPWTDARTSVFDPPVYDDPPASHDPAVYDSPDPGPAAGGETYLSAGGETYLEDEIPDEEVRQTSVIDSDPFAGRSSSLRRRYGEHYRRDEPLPDEDDDGPRSAVVHRLVIGGVAATVILLLGAYAFLAGTGDDDRDAAPEGALPSTTEAGDASTTSALTTQAPGRPAGEPSADRPAGTSTTSRPAAPDARRPRPSAPSTTAPASATPSTTATDGNAPPANPPPTTAPSGGTGGGSGGRDGDRPDADNDTLLEMLGLG
jgi:hypothetical protein